MLLLLHPSLLASSMDAIELVKPYVGKLYWVAVRILITLIFTISAFLSVKIKKWRPIILYVTAILLLTPYLPHIEIFVAKLLKITLRSLGDYIQIITLMAMGSLLFLSLVRDRRYRQIRAYIALLAILIGSYIVIKKLSSVAVETVHIVEYGGLAVVAFSTFRRQLKGITVLSCYLLAWDVAVIMGIVDECYQLILPMRYCGVDDMLNNATSGWIGLAFVWGFLRPSQER